MAFDANKEIKIEASQADDGSFTLRSRGLVKHRRAELEIAGVPEPALHAAGRVLNDVANYTVNRAEVLANQTVGLVLRAGDDEEKRPLMLALRTVAAEASKTGFWASLTGAGKGVLRLVDPVGEASRGPLIALTTMLIHRSAARLAGGDEDGAREELRAAIAIFPGDEDSKDPPTIGDGEAAFNWQNHLAYFALSELAEGGEAADLFAKGVARSKEHALRELGATLDALAAVDRESLSRDAARIVEHNFSTQALRDGPVPSAAHALVVSPIWEPADGGSVRSAALIPARFVELYYEGPAAEGLRGAGARLAADAVAEALSAPAALAWRVRSVRTLWTDPSAPIVEELDDAGAAHGLLSLALAWIARCFRAGASETEIRAGLRGEASPELATKLDALEAWETDQYSATLTMGG